MNRESMRAECDKYESSMQLVWEKAKSWKGCIYNLNQER